jgi:hypothetical protein
MMEAIVATVISIIAILGLAHSFGLGRGFIERFSVGRAALAAARGRMEALTVLLPTSDSLAMNAAFIAPFNFGAVESGTIHWRIAPYNDPITAGPNDLKEVTVVVAWGAGAERDSLKLTRLFLRD